MHEEITLDSCWHHHGPVYLDGRVLTAIAGTDHAYSDNDAGDDGNYCRSNVAHAGTFTNGRFYRGSVTFPVLR